MTVPDSRIQIQIVYNARNGIYDWTRYVNGKNTGWNKGGYTLDETQNKVIDYYKTSISNIIFSVN